MSDSEEENFCYYGKPLEPYDEDAFPKRRPITIEEQIATDAQGRRRFHGAFTGGFSAGFFNTVGSLEGWTPSEFKSTRAEKAESKSQKPEDFMDDEDIGEFGIAPQTIRATKDYSTTKKRKKQVFSDGPIPGEPVLHQLISSNETIGYLLLRNMGIKDKIQEKNEFFGGKKVIGCYMPKTQDIDKEIPHDLNQYEIPEIYQEFLKKPKDNTFGLGYQGLDKSHINLFQSSNLVIRDKNKKNVTITGQAFGVGAFEEDDEDIYVKDDMSKYDFEMSNEKDNKTNQTLNFSNNFIRAKNLLTSGEKFPPPIIPHSFTGKYKQKKSRFEPLPKENVVIERKNMNADIRAKYLGEEVSKILIDGGSKKVEKEVARTENVKSDLNNLNKVDVKNERENKSTPSTSLNHLFDRFVSATQPEDDPSNILEAVKPMETTHGTKEMKDAVKLKMFGPLTRISFDWQPCAVLCKRFNVPEPHFDPNSLKAKKRPTKSLIFEYQQHQEDISLKPGLTVQQKFNEETVEDINENVDKNEPMEVEMDSLATIKEQGPVEDSKSIDQEQKPSSSTEESLSKDDERPLSIDKEIAIEEGNPIKDETEKLDIAKNLDLFKAIFLSSSGESESEEEKDKEENEREKQKNRNEELKNVVLSDNFIPKIKSAKQGILSDIDFSKVNSRKLPEQSSNEDLEESRDFRLSEKKEDPAPSSSSVNLYGPALPKHLAKTNSSNNYSNKNLIEDSESDEWVEKTDKPKKKNKDKKKHKKHKKKHKHHGKRH